MLHPSEFKIKLTKRRIDTPDFAKTFHFENVKKDSVKMNTIDNNSDTLNHHSKRKIDIIRENILNMKERSNSALTKQRTEYKFGNKRLLAKIQRPRTKSLFTKKKFKNTDVNKKLLVVLIKFTENMNKNRSAFNRLTDIRERSNDLISNSSNKSHGLKYASNISERMITNFSDINMDMNKYNTNSKFVKKKPLKFRTKNHFMNNDLKDKISFNNTTKFFYNRENKFKNEFEKNKKKKSATTKNSQKNLLSYDILYRMQELKLNKLKNDFYKTLNIGSNIKSSKSNYSNSSNKVKYNSNNNCHRKFSSRGDLVKIPDIEANNFFKNHLSKRLNNFNNPNSEKSNYCKSSYSIRVNKTNYSNHMKLNI